MIGIGCDYPSVLPNPPHERLKNKNGGMNHDPFHER